ncbi:MAG: CNNM domain-containing protein [Chitinophagales bacterium]
MGLLLIYLSIALFFSSLCSVLEAVLLSLSPSFLNIKEKEGFAYATGLKELKANIDRPLIAILTLNTVAHTVGSIGVGTQAEAAFGNGSYVMAIISVVMTLLILVVSEIIPKTIGATYWKSLAPFTEKALRFIMWPLRVTGIIWILEKTTKLIGKGEKESVLSKIDFSVMAEISQKEGILQEGETRIIQNLMLFNKILVSDVMTPRTVLTAAPESLSIKDFYDKKDGLHFSRIPIFQNNIDNITGYVLKDELLTSLIEQKHNAPLKSISRKIMVVKEDLAVPDLFNQMRQEREHIAMVIDGYGGLEGIVTLEDIMETLLGLEIMDELDKQEDMQKFARLKWEQRAKTLGLTKDKK